MDRSIEINYLDVSPIVVVYFIFVLHAFSFLMEVAKPSKSEV